MIRKLMPKCRYTSLWHCDRITSQLMGNAFNRILHRISIGMVETFDNLRLNRATLTTQVTELILWTKGPQELTLPVIRLLKKILPGVFDWAQRPIWIVRTRQRPSFFNRYVSVLNHVPVQQGPIHYVWPQHGGGEGSDNAQVRSLCTLSKDGRGE